MLSLLAMSAVLAQGTLSGPAADFQRPPRPPAQNQSQGGEEKQNEKPQETDYQKAIKDHEAQDGVFKVFTKDEAVLFEIPKDMLGRDFLWVSEIKETPSGSYSGTAAGEKMVRWTKRGDKLLMLDIDPSIFATEGDEIKRGVAQSNVQPIITTFDIKAESPSGGMLIDMGRMFKSELPEFMASRAIGVSGPDPSRTFMERVLAFPDNINVEVLMTFRSGGGGGGRGFGGASSANSATALIHHSITVLPEEPMMPRLWDSRVGYFNVRVQDYGMPNYHGMKEYRYINRYRLEKKDPRADMSEPVKPITYYIAPEVPKEWHSYIKKGVEDWNVAFEAAGFRNAIRCLPAPNDPKWSPEDTRYSVIRWAPLPIANAIGPHVHDPRSGEIISAHVIIWHDVLKLGTDWYFTQASPMDKRAQKLPFPEDLMGEIVQFIVSHEVGHTLGLPHNGKGSAMVDTELLRDPQWTNENGTASTLMDYARFNYVAQPGDNALLIPKIGPYDKFSIGWGYTPLDFANTPWDEKPFLDGWAARQVGDPLLRFYDNFNSIDPTAQAEALGSDAMVASSYGVKNLERVMDYIIPATTSIGDDYSELDRMYGAVWGQYRRYIGHVMTNVGGVIETDYHAGRGGAVYKPVVRSDQRRAVQWMLDNVLDTPEFMMAPEVTSRIGSSTAAGRLSGAQSTVINGLLSSSRINRMIENEASNGPAAYTVAEMLLQVRDNVWRELNSAQPVVDAHRRAMQRSYVSGLIRNLQGSASEARAYAMDELKWTHRRLVDVAGNANHHATKIHLQDMAREIKMALDNPNPVASSGGGQTITFPFINDGVVPHCGCLFELPTMNSDGSPH